jgi:hypothetical protein
MNTKFPSRSESTVLKMAEDQRGMYHGFSDKGAHFAEWFEIAQNFLKLAFAETEGFCLSMRCLVTLLSTNLCQTIWCGTSMERCRQPHPLSRTEAIMRTEWMT